MNTLQTVINELSSGKNHKQVLAQYLSIETNPQVKEAYECLMQMSADYRHAVEGALIRIQIIESERCNNLRELVEHMKGRVSGMLFESEEDHQTYVFFAIENGMAKVTKLGSIDAITMSLDTKIRRLF